MNSVSEGAIGAGAGDDQLEWRGAMETVRGALRRELFTLAERPGLTWQQLHNRLQWADAPLADSLIAERERRSRPDALPWIHRHTALSESDSLIRTLTGHTDDVTACAVSPDGTWIVSASKDTTLKIWDVATGTERATLTGHTSWVTACAVSPDGSWVVSASSDGSLKIWDVATGAERATLTGHTGTISDCAVSPDGKWIVSSSDDRNAPSGLRTITRSGETHPPSAADVEARLNAFSLLVWDVASGRIRATLTGHTHFVHGCAVSPEGSWVVSASHDKSLRVWDLADGDQHRRLQVGAQVADCAVSPDGTWIASTSWDGDHTLTIWDVATGDERLTLGGHTGSVNECAVGRDGTWIVSASTDTTLKIWDMATGEERCTLVGHSGRVSSCAVSPDGTWVVSGSTDRTLKIWDAAIRSAEEHASMPTTSGDFEPPKAPRTFTGHTGLVSACAHSPDGTRIASASTDQTLRIWDAATGIERHALLGHSGAVNSCSFGRDGAMVVSSSADYTLKVWDAETGAERRTLSGHAALDLGGRTPVTGEVEDCSLSPDDTWIVSASGDHTLKIWDVATGDERRTLTGHTGPVNGCAVGPDGTWAVSASADTTLKIWDMATGGERRTLVGHAGWVTSCAVSPDGAWVLSASGDNTLRIWEPVTGTSLTSIPGHGDVVTDCAIGPDGALIASTSLDHTLRIWEAATGRERGALVLPGPATAVAFHPFAPLVACGDNRGGLYVAELVGITFGPLVVTAHGDADDLTVSCPACLEDFPIDRGRLDQQIECPARRCGTTLRTNPFVLDRAGTDHRR